MLNGTEPSLQVNILLVDDQPGNLQAPEAVLNDPNYHLVQARSGEEALPLLLQHDFAVVLLNLRLPDLDGFQTARLIRSRERSRHTPIIFLSAQAGDEFLATEVYKLGVVDYLVLPVVPEILRAKVAGFVELFREKKQARWQADQFRLLIQGTTDYAIFLLDPTGRVSSWNAGAERIKGYRAEEILGQHFSRFYPKEVIERGWPDEELRRAAAEGRFEDEGWRLRKDGSRFWANVVITALRDKTGQLLGFSKVTRDLSERKRVEEALRESEERFRLLVEGTVDYGIFMLDPQGRVISWNAGAERIKGYKAEEILGQHFARFYPAEDVQQGKPERELKLAA
ncbi:MAG: PAS domain S-box protein, partial [Planctomycetes bacterium]|nr:PAS domain S-box protein [Planctomycetota bacterium]